MNVQVENIELRWFTKTMSTKVQTQLGKIYPQNCGSFLIVSNFSYVKTLKFKIEIFICDRVTEKIKSACVHRLKKKKKFIIYSILHLNFPSNNTKILRKKHHFLMLWLAKKG